MLKRILKSKLLKVSISSAVITIGLASSIASITVSDIPILERPGYDYGAAIIDDGPEGRHMWWCAQEEITGKDELGHPQQVITDVIKYGYYDKISHKIKSDTVKTILQPQRSRKPAELEKWNNSFVCDPTVVKGNFVVNGITYKYAMYYTGTNMDENLGVPKWSGTNTRIGVAFSLDETHMKESNGWLEYVNNPIITPLLPSGNCGQTIPPLPAPGGMGTCHYGAGQPSAYSVDGQAGIWLMYTDTSETLPGPIINAERTYLVGSTDGIHFGPRTPVTSAGVPTDWTGRLVNADFAFDYVGRYWYATLAGVPGRRTPNVPTAEAEAYQFGLFRMPESTFPSTGTWEPLGFINTAKTLKEVNHNAAIARDAFGNVNFDLPNINIVYSRGPGISPDLWDLAEAKFSPMPSKEPLYRFYDSSLQRHWLTTTQPRPSYTLEGSVGSVFSGKIPGTIPISACLNQLDGYDQFITNTTDCEGGNYPLGIVGYIYDHLEPGSHAIWRCRKATPGHFVSTDSQCEQAGGGVTEYQLGWVVW